jgi:hypothetical protein
MPVAGQSLRQGHGVTVGAQFDADPPRRDPSFCRPAAVFLLLVVTLVVEVALRYGGRTLAAPPPRPPGSRRVAQDNREPPVSGHGRDATRTPAASECSPVADRARGYR